MRDPNRLDEFYKTMCAIHKKTFPDWRFGQLMSNFLGWYMYEKKQDPFFPEEDTLLAAFKEYGKYDEE